ncbi:MAG: hypothetical protein PVJ15_09455 [Gammaproteobacteria bacterium]|jgi:hypothetical protein
MRKVISLFVKSSLLSGLLAVSGFVYLQSAAAAASFFGRGAPASVDSLPAGDLRNSLESLPAKSRERALSWLQAVEFSQQDLPYIKVDPQGGIYYADTFTGDKSSASRTAKSSDTPPVTMTAKTIFRLHSRPGAAHTIFVDFDGGTIKKTAWNKYHRVPAWNAVAYDTDGKKNSFSNDEISDMAGIWQQIAEDYIPFDVDVTTEDPGKLGPTIGWILVTSSKDASARPMPEPGTGGVSYLNTFGFGQTAFYSPIFVYYDNLGSPAAVADAASHEMGHTIGLTHDGVTGSMSPGKGGSSNVSWSPIMGLDHAGHLTQWSRGDYRGATNTQDDVGILTGSLGRRGDDHEDTRFATGTPLAIDSRGRINAGNPYAVEARRNPENRGVIEDQDDIDVFVFKADAGTVDINISPARDAAHPRSPDGANLDIEATLYNARGKKIAASDPRDDTTANLKVKVPAGRYTIEVRGVGSSTAPYTSYGSLGQYFISGSVPARGNRSVAELTK